MTLKNAHNGPSQSRTQSLGFAAERAGQLPTEPLPKAAGLQEHALLKEKTQKYAQKQRRSFLEMLAKTGISTRLLRSNGLILGALASRHAAAAGGFADKKLVVISLSQGAPSGHWLPNSPTDTRELSHPYKDLGLAGLMAFREVNVLNYGNSSQYQGLGSVNRNAGQPTFDMTVGDVMGATMPYRSFYLGANALASIRFGEPQFLFSISNNGMAVDGPQATLERFFSNAPYAPDANAKMMLDLQRKQVEALKTKLGAQEQQRLQEHLDAMAVLEKRLVFTPTNFNLASCSKTGVNFIGDPIENGTSLQQAISFTIEQGKDQARLIASALACGLTNVVALQVGDSQNPFNANAHSGNFNAFVNDCRAQQTIPAEMLRLLIETKDAKGAPLIETTLLVVTNDMGNGIDHSPANSPWGIATQLPGFKTGFSAGRGGNCRDFFTAIAQGLGLPDATYNDKKGNPEAANILA